MCDCRPSRSRPARARTMSERNRRTAIRPTRVGTLPRRTRTSRSGRRASTCGAARAAGADTGAARQRRQGVPAAGAQHVLDRAARRHGRHRQPTRGSPPAGPCRWYGDVHLAGSEGALDGGGEEAAASTSASGTSITASPVEVISTSSIASSGATVARRPATSRACHSARALPRVPCDPGQRGLTFPAVAGVSVAGSIAAVAGAAGSEASGTART